MASLIRRRLLAVTLVGMDRQSMAQNGVDGIAGDQAILARAQPVAEGRRISLYADQAQVAPAFLARLEAALNKLEMISTRALDVITFGNRVSVVVSSATRVSHVWRGYAHPTDPRPIVFLSPRVVRDAMHDRDATYAHELAHLLTWRYHSHTLREGLADHLALQVLPGAAIGPVRSGDTAPGRVDDEIKRLLGSRLPPPDWLITDAQRRRDYYWASRCFVQTLIDRRGMATFLQLYDSARPEQDLQALYGADQTTLVRLAGL